MTSFDVIVVGLGGMGSAACYHLARRGARVLGLEQFSIAHGLGSSHGETRLWRRSYFAHPQFIPLLHRSFGLWADLEQRAGRQLFFRTGLLFAEMAPSAGVPADVERIAAHHGIVVQALAPSDARRIFPQVLVPDECAAYFEPDAGYVLAEDAVEMSCRLATAYGAQLHFHEKVRSFAWNPRQVEVVTQRATYRAGALVFAAGPWSGQILAELGMPLVIRRIPQLWFAAGQQHTRDAGMPCFTFGLREGFFYGVPSVHGDRFKICGGSTRRQVRDPSMLDRQLVPEDWIEVRRFVKDFVPAVQCEPVAYSMCMCTMTPDEQFVIDRHPNCQHVVVAAGFSGHGFKFCPAIGELIADLVTDRSSSTMDFLRLRWSVPGRVAVPGFL